MLFAYRFQRHPLSELHASVRAFIHKLHRGGLDPANFDIDKCCTGQLLERARAGDLLPQKLKAFYDAWFGLDNAGRQQVRRAFVMTNQIRKQMAGTAPRITLEELPEVMRVPAHELFVHLYEKSLTKARSKSHWKTFYEELPIKVCPFCGVELLHHPDLLKQDYDHILCKRRYPFAAVNLRNLVPCGRDCNQVFKHEKDVLWDDLARVRRRSFFPFEDHGEVIGVNLAGSRLPTMDNDPGDWHVSVEPDIEEVRTWSDVFEIPRRYSLEVFATEYDRWRDDFLMWVGPQAAPPGGWGAVSVRDRMAAYSLSFTEERFKDKRFLKRAMFEFLREAAGEQYFAALAAQLNSRSGGN